jgi:hypothetical protein
MSLDEARELRRELEAIEATMERIRDLSRELPGPDDFNDMETSLGNIDSTMDAIIEKDGQIPTAEEEEY